MAATIFLYIPHIADSLSGEVGPRSEGGAESYYAQLVRYLHDETEHEIVVLTFDRASHAAVEVRTRPWWVRRGGGALTQSIYRLTMSTQFRPTDACRRDPSRRRIALLGQMPTPDVVAAARRAGCEVAYRLGADALVDGTPYYKGRPSVTDAVACIPLVDHVLATSTTQQRALRESWGRESHLLAPGIPQTDAGLKAPSETAEAGYALWVGRPSLLKGPWDFVRLAQRMPAHRFKMVIRSALANVELMEWLQDMLASTPNLSIEYDVSNGDMADHYARASAYVLLSVTEGMPRTVLEAAAVGTPTYSLVLDPCEALSVGGLGHSFGGDIEALAVALDSHLSTGGPTDSERAALVARTRRDFSFENSARSLLEGLGLGSHVGVPE